MQYAFLFWQLCPLGKVGHGATAGVHAVSANMQQACDKYMHLHLCLHIDIALHHNQSIVCLNLTVVLQ